MFSNGRRDIDWKDRQRDPTWLRRTSLKYPRCLENLIITISSQERRDAGVPKKMERQGYRRAVIYTTMWRLNQDHIATRWIFLMQLHLPCISIRLCGHSSPANCFSIDCFPRRWSSILGKSLRKRFGLQFMGANHMRSKYQEFSKTIERYEWRQSFFWFLKLSRAHSSGPCFFLPNIQQANLSPASCSQANCGFPRRMKVPHGVLVTIWIIPNRSQSILFRLAFIIFMDSPEFINKWSISHFVGSSAWAWLKSKVEVSIAKQEIRQVGALCVSRNNHSLPISIMVGKLRRQLTNRWILVIETQGQGSPAGPSIKKCETLGSFTAGKSKDLLRRMCFKINRSHMP